jgi:alpha-L-rhamnosidase
MITNIGEASELSPRTGKMITAYGLTVSPRLRREFNLEHPSSEIVDAIFIGSALGVFECWLNGELVNDELLAPGWTSYEWRVRYTVTDVTKLLVANRNVLAMQLGKGWFATGLFKEPHARYGERPAGFAELHIRYANGDKQIIATDEEWDAGPGPITRDNLYTGQSIDARERDGSWLQPGFSSSEWQSAESIGFDISKFERQFGPPIRRLETREPLEIFLSPSGRILVDFGQNLVGWVRVEVRGTAGESVTLRHAEVLEHGELGTRPLRTAVATDIYTLSGDDDVFEPTLTFHGFRFAEVEGWPGGIEALKTSGGLTAVVIGSAMERTGWFNCSNDDLNRLHENVVWSTKGNFLGIPTDCPQRDERLGWTGDIAVFAPTASFLYDTSDFLREWLRDVVAEQAHLHGIVPWVVPDILKYFKLPDPYPSVDTTAIWSDAIAWVPWALWKAYGDRRVLEETFDGQVAHARRALSQCSPRGVWEGHFQFGDWLDPDAPPDEPRQAKADTGVVATLSLYRTLNMIAEAAAILGRPERAQLLQRAERLKRAFHEAYVLDGRIESDCTTVYTLAICFAILEEADLEAAGRRLAELVRRSDFRISTGFAGTPYICDALTLTGHLDEAYSMLLQTQCPSWLYPVKMGATTIWERWDSMLPDGTINPGQMTSFNHYALGAVADWMHRVIGGVAPASVADGHFRLAPRPGGGISWAETSWRTRKGMLRFRWDIEDGELRVLAEVPPGATAELQLPAQEAEQLPAGAHRRTVTLQ